MKILLQYHYRLGDIVRLFPIAKHYAAQGHGVFIECLPQYWGIFEAVSYVRPVSEAGIAGTIFDMRYPLQIWPERYADFRASSKKQMDYVYGLFPEFADIDRTICFDRANAAPDPRTEYDLPDSYHLLFPFSNSSQQVPIARLFQLANGRLAATRTFLFMEDGQRMQLVEAGFPPACLRSVKSLGHLPRLIRDAQEVLTVNTATTIIASAVRSHYYHVAEPNLQDNWCHPSQTVLIP